LNDRIVHGVASQAQRLAAHHVTADQNGGLGRPAADVHNEGATPFGEVVTSTGGGRHRLVDEPYPAARFG
jgi:hypothetical protein